MTMSQLKNLYPQIQPWDRIRLLLAAQHRHDEVECQRLFKASPLKTWCFSEHLLAEQALHVLTLTYITEQLDALACLFFALFQISHHPDPDLEYMADHAAYFFSINAQAWNSFCDTIHFSAVELVAANQFGCMLRYGEQYISALAPTSEELMARHGLPGSLITSQDLAKKWKEQLQSMIASTPLDTLESTT